MTQHRLLPYYLPDGGDGTITQTAPTLSQALVGTFVNPFTGTISQRTPTLAQSLVASSGASLATSKPRTLSVPGSNRTLWVGR